MEKVCFGNTITLRSAIAKPQTAFSLPTSLKYEISVRKLPQIHQENLLDPTPLNPEYVPLHELEKVEGRDDVNLLVMAKKVRILVSATV